MATVDSLDWGPINAWNESDKSYDQFFIYQFFDASLIEGHFLILELYDGDDVDESNYFKIMNSLVRYL